MNLDFLRPLFDRPGSWVSVYLDTTGPAIFAQAGEVAMLETLSAPPAADEAYLEPLPHIMPLIAQRAAQVPYVRVLTDRTGADLDALSAGGAPRHREVTGSAAFPLRKVHVGGWSHRHYLQAVEESWKRRRGGHRGRRRRPSRTDVRGTAAHTPRFVRAIAATGAQLVLIGPGEVPLTHGIGAVLRYADAGNTAG